MTYYDIMKRAALEVSLDFSEEMYHKFMVYMKLLKEWNEKINLTAITEEEEIIKKHFIDSIKAFKAEPFKECSSLIDVGSGAGFPGLPIAIVKPEINIVLLDSLNKRVNFLNTVISVLELKNIKAIHGRAEEEARKKEHREKYDIATSRAVANMSVLSEFCLPFVKNKGYFIPLKGPAVEEELEAGEKAIKILGGELKEIIKVEIEESDMAHNLVVVKKIKSTPSVYPRKAGSISKKPLR
ncbi:16S rRNA (guanine(527)-N(7))-methyltransferase RsmG [Clostridium polynesiense]|uniref:16S rRNA (guanine(527)-N(7))-methyltransferase RsmG n=1 Tax=Clostridium polynesiense TaxID=1325933 RepID=UPI00058F7EF2|nr:16S rRNA (guanine(527)-N(7))-methyltransferase RsmG [Clostridium polynesiense]